MWNANELNEVGNGLGRKFLLFFFFLSWKKRPKAQRRKNHKTKDGRTMNRNTNWNRNGKRERKRNKSKNAPPPFTIHRTNNPNEESRKDRNEIKIHEKHFSSTLGSMWFCVCMFFYIVRIIYKMCSHNLLLFPWSSFLLSLLVFFVVVLFLFLFLLFFLTSFHLREKPIQHSPTSESPNSIFHKKKVMLVWMFETFISHFPFVKD